MTDRGTRIRAKYGRPEPFNVDTALALLPDVEVARDNAFAFRYPSGEAADAFADANRANGINVWRVPAEGAAVNLIDLTPKLQAMEKVRG